ncbi:uncharacterized protein C10orf67, mitochondrial-like isoform X4 [Montipora foliosa]|uniref:uncharacterized protein C10orf67, mitochondrial-like isoform X4 n=1 Tax=Montipora foliosa TaxID=591990 RepID=UPI0035F100E4
MAADMETVKSADKLARSISAMSGKVSRPGSISPARTPFSPTLMELDEYRPSLADQVRVGFFSQDRSAQTNISEIAQLKEMTEVLQNLVSDIETLKRSLHYAKHVLQADYENKLEERALDLYCRVNDRILELEKQHEERVNVIRRSYRQQLADAITQIANQHETFYAKKSKQDKASFSEKLKKVQDDDEDKRRAQMQQDSIIEMMRMQMKDAQERADTALEEALQRPESVSSVSTNPEIYELREEVEKLENKLDAMMNQLEDKENENRRLVADIDDLNDQLNGERGQIRQLKKDLSDALLTVEQERNNFKAELQRQKLQLQSEMDAKIQETKKNLMAASRKQVEELQRSHDKKIKEQQLLEEKRRQMESQEKEVKPQVKESENIDMLKKLQKLEKKQKAEIERLKKELERVNRTWEIKVNVLKQTLHALKDESFLRTSLQRQAARLQQAAVMYASDGPAVFARDRNALQGRILKTLETPGRVKETVRFTQAQRPYADTPFTEDRPTPAPQDEDEPSRTSNDESSIDVLAGQSVIATNENTDNAIKSESSISSRQVVDPV